MKVKHIGSNWFDDDLRTLRKKRRAEERRKRKHPTAGNLENYKNICAKFNKLVWTKKKSFYQQSLNSSKGDTRALFKKIKKLMGTDVNELPYCVNDVELAEQFKSFFCSKISSIRTDIEVEKNTSPSYNPVFEKECNKVDCSLNYFCSMSEIEVSDVVKGMSTKFCSLDPIPTWLFKESLPELLPLLCYIVNESLKVGIFPQSLKHAIIKPTIKANKLDPESCSSYRPVSNLSFVSKVLEKCVFQQLITYLENNDLICDVQSGYRANHSCETLLVRMFNDINEHVVENNAIALILLDLSAAFDTIDHKILIEKLENDYGIGCQVLMWIQSYLECRSFAVKVNHSTSSSTVLICGVPQGSLLGPILFILYTKDLKKIAEAFGLSIHLYADDGQIYIEFDVLDSNDIAFKLSMIEDCLKAIKLWMVHHFMQLNEKKTELIILGKPAVLNQCPNLVLSFNEAKITQTDFKNESAKTLGIKLDPKLTMERQASDVKKKVYWTISNLRNFGHYLTEDLKITLVKTLILSRIDYCNSLYVGVTSAILKKLQNSLDSAVRCIYNIRDWSTDLTPYYKKSHILPVRLRIKYKTCLLVHKALEGTAPPYIQELISLYHHQTNKKSLRSFSDKRLLRRSQINETKISRRMFSFHAPLIWNALPMDIRHCHDREIFKTKLKTLYFSDIDCNEL